MREGTIGTRMREEMIVMKTEETIVTMIDGTIVARMREGMTVARRTGEMTVTMTEETIVARRIEETTVTTTEETAATITDGTTIMTIGEATTVMTDETTIGTTTGTTATTIGETTEFGVSSQRAIVPLSTPCSNKHDYSLCGLWGKRFIQIEFNMYMHAWLSSIQVKKAICCDGFRMFM